MDNDRLTERLSRVKNLVAKPQHWAKPTAIPPRYERLAGAVGGQLVPAPSGNYVKVVSIYPFGFEFGSTCLQRPADGSSVAVASYTALECEGEVALGRLLFIDTETTGLSGAGAVPFLVGCGSLTQAGFEIRQYLLPEYTDEAAMLEQVLAELGGDRTLVSYNGAAFDLNLIRDRFIVNRVARDVPCAGHFDLLHPVRRLFKRRLNDCSLTSIEREIFGYYRSDDLPGHLIPSVYFDWLQTESVEFLPAVLEHNKLDILSLFFLLLHVDSVFRSEGAVLDFAEDIYSLSRVYGRRRRHQAVIANFETLRRSIGPPLTDEILLFHSMAFKRQGDWAGALEIWHKLAEGTGPEAAVAALELAKHYEHREGDMALALDNARKAGRLDLSSRQRKLLELRVARLCRKLAVRTR
ncbi:MAG: ribonuclease H-like domain-containing protein [Candidatus Zixiibacteriota bacterium]